MSSVFKTCMSIGLGVVLISLIGELGTIHAQDASSETPKAPAISPNNIPELTQREHPWGRFSPKIWICTQTTTDTYLENRILRNVSDTRTTLDSIDEDGLTFREITTVDMGGKRIVSAPVVKKFDFFQEQILEGTVVKNAAPTKLTIDNLIVPCGVRVYEQTTPNGKRTSTVWYSTQIYPYVLRVERVLKSVPTDPNSEAVVLSQSTTEVLETAASQLWKAKLGTYRIRSIKKSGNITAVTESSCSRQYPGGMFKETTKEFDKSGKIIRTIDTRLINYPLSADEIQTPVPGFYSAPSPEPIPIPVRPRWRRFYYAY